MRTTTGLIGIGAMAIAMVVGAATAQAAGVAGAMEAFRAAIAQCTETHSYNPDDDTLSQTALGENERAWAACAYKSVETHLMPATRIPEMYEFMIGQHREMTDAIASGTMTRAERRARMDRIFASIRNQEAALHEGNMMRHSAPKAAAEGHKRLLEMQRRQDDMIRMHRSLQMRLR